ncbi:A-adding tRNA nucleotidyltransferase [subsurface metagenome]
MKKLQAEFRDKEFFIQHFGRDVYAVGGFVRDLIREKPPTEVDILIARHSVEDIQKKIESFGKVDLVGKSFGVIKFTIDKKTYDIALPRKDKPKGTAVKKHKDFIISAEPDLPLEKDLERRDFRCNSMALRLSDNTLIDPFKGEDDTKAEIIRLTNPQAFPDDPLRVLRAARFASVLEFKIDKEIYKVSRGIDLSDRRVERVIEEVS